jgi:hypothetical protein
MRPRTLAYLFGAVYLLLLAPNVFLFSSMYRRFMHRPEEQPLALVIGLVLELSAFLLTVGSAQYGSRVSVWFKTGALLALVIVWITCGLEVWTRNPLGYIWNQLPVGTSSFARFAFAVMGSITALFTVILGHAMGQMMHLETSGAPVQTPVIAPVHTHANPVQHDGIKDPTPDIVRWARTRKSFTVGEVAQEFGLGKAKARETLNSLTSWGLECENGKGWRAIT